MTKDSKSGALYDGFIADYYDLSPIVVARHQDVAFYREAAEETGDPVLELGCGTGRVTTAIAQGGLRITGLDLSKRMLERAERKRAALPLETRKRVQLVHGDMTRFKLREKFRLIIAPFRPFQHLIETQQQIDCLVCARKHLKRGGRLILDFFQTDAERMHDAKYHEESPMVEYDTPDGKHVRMTERVEAFHRAEQRNDVEMIFYVTDTNGRTERLVFAWTLRYFFRYEVEHLLARSGFRVCAVYGNFDRSALTDTSPEMIFVAEPR